MAGGVLDMEVGTAFAALRSGLDWWLGELGEMARPLLAPRGAAAPGRLVAVRRPEGYALYRDSAPAGRADPRQPTPAALALAEGAALARTLPAPGLTERDWRRLLLNDVDRLTPFAAGDAYAAVRFAPGADGGRRAEFVATPRHLADAALADALAGGIAPTALVVEASDGQPIDLLPAVRAAGGFGGPRGGVSRWWIAVALLVALNLGLAIWRDVRETDRLRAAVAEQQPVAQRLQRLRRQVEGEAARRRALLAARGSTPPLRVLDAATRAVPDGAWVQRLAYDNGVLRLSGYHRPGIDVAAAMQADPAFVNVRNAAADLTPAVAGGAAGEPFDIAADLRVAARLGGASRP